MDARGTVDKLILAIRDGGSADSKEIQRLIIDLRTVLGLNSTQLSEKLGVSLHTVSRWINGKNIPQAKNIEALRGCAYGSDLEQDPYSYVPGGSTMPVNSPLYIDRPTDYSFKAALNRHDAIVLLRGPGQVGKSSLLARGVQAAKQNDAKTVVTDFQKVSTQEKETLNTFWLAVAKYISRRLDLKEPTAAEAGSPLAFEQFLVDQVVGPSSSQFVWFIDEADSIFDCSFRSDVFALFRSWWNERAVDPGGPFDRVTVVLTYSTEAHLFIPNVHLSPFAVGTLFQLSDFSIDELRELNIRYGAPLDASETTWLHEFVGGHPYLSNLCLYAVKTQGAKLHQLENAVERGSDIFHENVYWHMAPLYEAVAKNPTLSSAVRSLLDGNRSMSEEAYSSLRSAGIVAGDSYDDVRMRSRLHESYFGRRLR